MLSILVHAASPFIPRAEKYCDYIMKMVDSNMDAGPRKKKTTSFILTDTKRIYSRCIHSLRIKKKTIITEDTSILSIDTV